MNQQEDAAFAERAAQALDRIERGLDDSGFEVERAGDGIVEIEFEDGSQIVVNRHSVAREIWVAARSGGFHFRWDGGRWIDTRSGEELFAALGRLVAAQSGKTISFD